MRELIRRKSKECMNRLVRSGIKGSQEKGRKEDSSGSENILQENLTPKLPVFENESEEFELLHPYELQNLLLPSPPLAQADTKSNIYTHYTGVPASRLHLHPYQRLLMKAQLSQHRSRDLFEESFYHQWNVLGVTSNKELRLEMIIETKYELELFHQNLTAKKIHIFRDGVYPRKQSLTNGFTIVLKVVEESNALKLFSSVTYPILSNNIYGGANVLQISICGVSYKRHLEFSTVTIWVYGHPIECGRSNFIETQTAFLLQKVLDLTQANEYLFPFFLVDHQGN